MASTNYELTLSGDGKTLEGIRITGDGPLHVAIPDDVTSIGDEAFAGCTNLTSITAPDRLMDHFRNLDE